MLLQGGDFNSYPNEITPYSSLWDPHHCLSGQNPSLSGYSDIITAFNSELGLYLLTIWLLSILTNTSFLVWPRQQCSSLVSNRLNRNVQQNGQSGTQKKPRRRVATLAQRRAANIRERRRMFNLNEAFDKLRRKVLKIVLKLFCY